MTPNVGALLAIIVGLVLVYVAVKGSQSTFFKSFMPASSSTSSTSTSSSSSTAASGVMVA